MKERAGKIFGLLFFLLLCGGIVYIMLSGAQAHNRDKYEKIEVTGIHLLKEEEYLSYSGLSDTSEYTGLTLAEVKKTLEKHPYVINAEVRFDGINGIIAELQEKKPKALLLENNKFNMITVDGEMLPVINRELMVSLPIISNLMRQGDGSLDIGELNAALRIIDVVKIIDEKMFESLAEINLRNGGDILIMISGLPFPVIFGRKDEVKKILALREIKNELLDESGLLSEIEYIDLRYKNKIFIGKRKSAELTGKPEVL